MEVGLGLSDLPDDDEGRVLIHASEKHRHGEFFEFGLTHLRGCRHGRAEDEAASTGDDRG